jgi:hypothetical protein
MTKLKNNDLNNVFSESSFDFPSQATVVDVSKQNQLPNLKSSNDKQPQLKQKFSAPLFNFKQPQLGGGFSATSSEFRQPQLGGGFSATSSEFRQPQLGGGFSATSSDIRQSQLGGNFSATSSDIRQSQLGGGFSATSSVLRQSQLGGNFSATSSVFKQPQSGGNNNSTDNRDVDTLLAMLTSENDLSDSENTNTLEMKLKNKLNTNMQGGNNVQNRNNNNNVEVLPNMFTSEVMSEVVQNNLSGGGTRFIVNEDNNEFEFDLEGGAKVVNKGMAAFLKLKKFVSEKLEISNGVPAGKVAGAVLREVKSKYENITTEDAVKKAMKHFENNIEKFRKML